MKLFHTPTYQPWKCPSGPTLLQIEDFLILFILVGIKCYLIVVLNCTFLMTNDVDHIFMFLLLAICISSFVKYLFKSSAHFY